MPVFEEAEELRLEIRFELGFRDFAWFADTRRAWRVEPGDFRILVGASSRDIRLEAPLRIAGAAVEGA